METITIPTDGFGPAKVVVVQEPSIALQGVLVIDNVAIGPSIGGLRMATDVSVTECARLARAMTLKNAAAGLPHGGGKSVLVGDPGAPRDVKERWIRGFAHALRHEEDYIFGPDMGTDEACMAWVRDEIGRAVGLPRAIGGIPLDEIGATGWGLRHAIAAALPSLGLAFAGLRVVVQGFGAVGAHAARFLANERAILVAASDSTGAIANPDGLDVGGLIAHKQQGHGVATFDGGTALARDEVVGVACDVWIPAARPDVIHEGNVERLRARLVAQGANIPLTEGAERYLHDKGVLCLPDFIANAGGVICAAMEYRGADEAAAMQAVERLIAGNTTAVLARSRAAGTTPRAAATELATGRVREAMRFKRWSIF